MTRSNRVCLNRSMCLVVRVEISIPLSAITRTALGCNGFGWLPALRARIVARVMLEKRFGHLRASAVSRAEEEHDWSPPRRAPIQGRRSDVEAQAGLQSRADATQQIAAATHFDSVIGIAPVR